MLWMALVLGFAVGCGNEGRLVWDPDPINEPDPGSIRGRVCSPSGRSWLPDAVVYTNLLDERGVITEVRKTFSDRDGNWMLADLPGNREYEVHIQSQGVELDRTVVFVGDADQVTLPSEACFDPTALDIALISGDYDDVDLVLEHLGFTSYTQIDGANPAALAAFLTDPEQLSRYDLVFFNGGHVEQGVIYDGNPANETPDRVAAALRAYVQAGGAVFATDWAYDVVEGAWPDAIDFVGDDRIPNAAQLGEYADIDAQVTDEALAGFLGKNRIGVAYDLPVWPPMSAVQPYVSLHLSGTVSVREGTAVYTLPAAPLLVSFSDGQGRVGFSTFRFAANDGEDSRLVLQHLLGAL